MEQPLNLPYIVITAFTTGDTKLYDFGLMIPFLIGVYKRLHENQGQPFDLDSPECIENLIHAVVNNRDGQRYLLSPCPNNGELVLSLPEEAVIEKFSKRSVIHNIYGQPILYLGLYAFWDIKTNPSIEEIIERLYKKYGDKLKNGEFSINNRKWGDYSAEEEALITKILDDL